jgi:hypothetical protein
LRRGPDFGELRVVDLRERLVPAVCAAGESDGRDGHRPDHPVVHHAHRRESVHPAAEAGYAHATRENY